MEANEKAKLVVIEVVNKIAGIVVHGFTDSSWFGFKADVIVSDDAAYETFCDMIAPFGLTAKIERPYDLGDGKRGLRIVIDVPKGWTPPER